MDCIMQDLANENTQLKEHLFFAVKLAWQKPSKYFPEVTPIIFLLVISIYLLDTFQKLKSFWKWEKVIDIDPEDKTLYTTQFHKAILKYLDNEYCAKHWCLPIIKP